MDNLIEKFCKKYWTSKKVGKEIINFISDAFVEELVTSRSVKMKWFRALLVSTKRRINTIHWKNKEFTFNRWYIKFPRSFKQALAQREKLQLEQQIAQ